MRRIRRYQQPSYRRKRAGISEHLILPAVGGGASALLTLLSIAKTKGSIKEKLKRLIRNAALGTIVGGGLEAGRTGITGLYDAFAGNNALDGNTTADGNFLKYK